jgi:hypothetical protein
MNWRSALLRSAWPAFLVAAIAEIIAFVAIDPIDLVIFGLSLNHVSRTAVYSLGFGFFWSIAYAASTLSLVLATDLSDLSDLSDSPESPEWPDSPEDPGGQRAIPARTQGARVGAGP